MEKNLVAFLDLLGFSEYVKGDIIGANELLRNYQEVILRKIVDDKISQTRPCEGRSIRKLVEYNGIDSFDYFLPFSDSIFIVSSNPNMFLRQVSSFLINSFQFTSEAYKNPENIDDPNKVSLRLVSINGSSNVTEVNWYPTLFRGGLSYGDVFCVDLNGLIKKQVKAITNLTGEAVVKAVKLEKTKRGPRLFLDQELYKMLHPKSKKFIVKVSTSPKCYEVLWPAFHYIETNRDDDEIHKFDDLFLPAANLWKAYNHKDYSEHYYQFLVLIVKSSLIYFANRKYSIQAKDYIIKSIARAGLESKTNDLITLP